jgi:hypothetical protein
MYMIAVKEEHAYAFPIDHRQFDLPSAQANSPSDPDDGDETERGKIRREAKKELRSDHFALSLEDWWRELLVGLKYKRF